MLIHLYTMISIKIYLFIGIILFFMQLLNYKSLLFTLYQFNQHIIISFILIEKKDIFMKISKKQSQYSSIFEDKK